MTATNFFLSFNRLIFLMLSILISCAKDKNLDDFRRDQLQQNLSRITSISGQYSGPVISKIDGSNLGNLILKFKASTNVQSNSGDILTNRSSIVSGSIKLQSLSTAEVSFDNGYYDYVTGDFQVTISVPQESGVVANLSLVGIIANERWIGSIEIKGQTQNGADLNLLKNSPPTNITAIEAGGTRLEQLRRMNYRFIGLYKIDTSITPFKLTFISRDILPVHFFYKIFSPIRQVSINCDMTDFELNFSNAVLDDNAGTLVAHDPTDNQGHPARATLSCNKFEEGIAFGWDCELQTKNVLLKTHLIAKKLEIL